MNRTAALLGVAVVLLLASCADDGHDDGATATSLPATTATTVAYPLDDTLRLNEIQALGSHNSYHVQAEPALFAALQAFDPALADDPRVHAPRRSRSSSPDRACARSSSTCSPTPPAASTPNRAGNAVIGVPPESGRAGPRPAGLQGPARAGHRLRDHLPHASSSA